MKKFTKSFERNSKDEIMEELNTLVISKESKKRYGLSMEDILSDNPLITLEIVNKVIRDKIKIDVEGQGTLDSSAAFLLATAKLTGGKSSVFYSTEFDLSVRSKDKKKLKRVEIQNVNILKAFKYLNCNEKAIKSILEKGEVISAYQALKLGIVSEITELPDFAQKKSSKKENDKNGNDKNENDKNENDKNENDKKEQQPDEKNVVVTTDNSEDKDVETGKKLDNDKSEGTSALGDVTSKNPSQPETNSDNTDAVKEPEKEEGSTNDVKNKK